MAVGSGWSTRRALAAAFPERRIYLRTDERTRYLSFGAGTQIAVVVAALALLLWTGFTTATFVGGALDGQATRTRIETTREAYEARIAALGVQQRALEEELHQANLRRDAVTERLSGKQSRLVDTANRLQEAEAELTVLRDQFERLTNQRRDDQGRIARLAADLARAETSLARTETSKANLADAFGAFSGTVEQVIEQRDDAVAKASRLSSKLTETKGALDRMEDREERVLGQIEQAARTGLAGMRRLFGRTDMDIDDILSKARRDYTGTGGPFLPIAEGEDIDAGDLRVAALVKDLETLNLMRFTADRLPFALPAQGGRFTSGFGKRRDPKGRGWAFHAGLDIAGPRGTAIRTTADGVVTFVGRQHGYGIMVKIRHAFGFETVYAHLSRARVKVGQRVSRGDRIADMGNTGRTTGTHLHYEIRIDKEPVNPRKFIEAAKDVL